jgi:hypothetical protein
MALCRHLRDVDRGPLLRLPASGVLDEGYVTSACADTQVALGAFFEFFLIVTNLGTVIALLPVLRRYSEIRALGYFGARIVESTFIAVGLLALLMGAPASWSASGTGCCSAG